MLDSTPSSYPATSGGLFEGAFRFGRGVLRTKKAVDRRTLMSYKEAEACGYKPLIIRNFLALLCVFRGQRQDG